jgi:prepilin-type N-terminal cleavage/methylation domain-containing protein
MCGDCRGARAFTLAEMLVALTVFAALMAIVSQSLGMTAGLLDRLDQRYAPEARALGRLRDAVASAVCYVIRDEGGLGGETSYRFHFHAAGEELRFITRKPVCLEEMAVARLRRDEDALLLEEAPLFGGEVDYRHPDLPPKATTRRVLLEDVSAFGVRAIPDDPARMPDAVQLTIVQRERERVITVRIHANDHSRLGAMRDLEYWRNPAGGMR